MMETVERRRQRAAELRACKTMERRRFAGECEFRASAEDSRFHFGGYASLTGVPYQVGDFTEIIKRNAFKRTLGEAPDVVFRIEHEGLPLARTARPGSRTGTLRLLEDDRGLDADADFDKEDPDAQKLKIKMDNGLVDEMSFSFRVVNDEWNSDYTKRTVNSVILHGGDVSVVTFGASPQTGATTSIRSAMQYELAVRSRYGAHELGALGKAGMAFMRPDGGWSFPTKTRADYDEAVKMVQLSGSSHDAVRRYLLGRAKAEGWPIPVNWASDGSARARTMNSWRQRAQEQEIEVMRLREGPMCARRAGARR